MSKLTRFQTAMIPHILTENESITSNKILKTAHILTVSNLRFKAIDCIQARIRVSTESKFKTITSHFTYTKM